MGGVCEWVPFGYGCLGLLGVGGLLVGGCGCKCCGVCVDFVVYLFCF